MKLKKYNKKFMQENSMELDDKREYNAVTYRPITPDEFMEITMKIIKDEKFTNDENEVSIISAEPDEKKEVSKVKTEPAKKKEVSKIKTEPAEKKVVSEIKSEPAEKKVVSEIKSEPAEKKVVSEIKSEPAEKKVVSEIKSEPAEKKVVSEIKSEPAEKKEDSNIEVEPDGQESASIYVKAEPKVKKVKIKNPKPPKIKSERMENFTTGASTAKNKTIDFCKQFTRFTYDSVNTSNTLSGKITMPQSIFILAFQAIFFGFIFASIAHTLYNYMLRSFGFILNSIPYRILDIFGVIDKPRDVLVNTVFNPPAMFLFGLILSVLTLLCLILFLTLFSKLFRIKLSFVNSIKTIASSNIPIVIANLFACLFISILDERFYNPYFMSLLIMIIFFSHLYASHLRVKILNNHTDRESRPIKAVALTSSFMLTLPILGANLGILSIINSIQAKILGTVSNIGNFFTELFTFS